MCRRCLMFSSVKYVQQLLLFDHMTIPACFDATCRLMNLDISQGGSEQIAFKLRCLQCLWWP
jgi:hypothetical protein